METENGFTLLEVILSLVIAGLMVSVVGILMVLGVQEYVSSKENVAISQKVSLALKRIEKEMRGLTVIDPANSDDTCVRYKLETISPYFRAIGIRGNTIELKVLPDSDCDCSSSGHVLLDQVSGIALSYQDNSASPPVVSSTPPVTFSDLSGIRVVIDLDHQTRNLTKKFEVWVNPRNNGNVNGP